MQLERTKELMNARLAQDALVEGYESLLAGLTLPDPDDRHVLAAAIHVRAGLIVTFNLKDFPAEALAPHGVQAKHPDEFVSQLLDDTPALVCAAAKRQRASLKKPPKSVAEYLEVLERVGLPQTASAAPRCLGGCHLTKSPAPVKARLSPQHSPGTRSRLGCSVA